MPIAEWCQVQDEQLAAILQEFGSNIYPALAEGFLPRRDPAEYRFRVTYPPTALLPAWNNRGSTDWIKEIPVGNKIALYVHVPFCHRVCTFCHFSVARLPDSKFLLAYANLLLRELHLWMDALPAGTLVDSVYVGGGTPTALPLSVLNRLLSSITSIIPTFGTEVTVEASPLTLTEATVDVLKANKVTRVSIGIQDLNPEVHQLLRRDHSLVQALEAIERGVGAWPGTLNVDLIFGLPNQSIEHWFQTLRTIQGMQIPSVTVYQLNIAKSTALRTLWRRHPEMFPDEASNLAMRWVAHRLLGSVRCVHDPIDWYLNSPAARCRHQIGKWSGEVGLVGVGPTAYWGNPTIAGRNHSLPTWTDLTREGRLPVGRLSRLSGARAAARYAVFGLKTRSGVRFQRLRHYLANEANTLLTSSAPSNPDSLIVQSTDELRLSEPLGILRAEEVAERAFDAQTSERLRAMEMSNYSE